MKKFSFVFIFLTFVGFYIFADTGELSEAQEEVNFLLFLPNSGSQFVDEERAMADLDNVARYLRGRNLSPGQVHVDGYTAVVEDNTDSYELSMERALFVINELIKRGVSGNFFADPGAYGAVDYWGSNIGESERSPNRRVRILLDGRLLTPGTIGAFGSVTEEDKNTGFCWWWLLLLLIPLIAALLFFLRSRKAVKAPSIVPAAAAFVDMEEEIRIYAYELHLERNGWNENPYEDWCKAVTDVCAKYEADGFQTYTEDGTWRARRG